MYEDFYCIYVCEILHNPVSNFVCVFQVSRLVILHEEAEDGNAMPDLARPVQTVKLAVDNLVKVSLSYSSTQQSSSFTCYFVSGYQGVVIDRSLSRVIFYIVSTLHHNASYQPQVKNPGNLQDYPSRCASKSSKLIKINFVFKNIF